MAFAVELCPLLVEVFVENGHVHALEEIADEYKTRAQPGEERRVEDLSPRLGDGVWGLGVSSVGGER